VPVDITMTFSWAMNSRRLPGGIACLRADPLMSVQVLVHRLLVEAQELAAWSRQPSSAEVSNPSRAEGSPRAEVSCKRAPAKQHSSSSSAPPLPEDQHTWHAVHQHWAPPGSILQMGAD
jgi:hypothetical protein